MTILCDADPLVGRVLDGRYELTRRIGQGGMAVIYQASDLRLSRTVAVKIMHETYGGDPGFVARFEREATAAARLSHPNVVSVFDRGVDANRPYIVMEYIEGTTLRRVMTHEGAMPPARMLELITPVIAAVAAAHEAGIVHRDLKPENVFISTRGQLKVGDFGLARGVTTQTTRASGTLIGTVSYIAPELVTSGKGDTRADVYALGIMMFEMLTGRKPHTGENPVQVVYSHVHNPIEPPSRGASVPVPDYVDAIVMSAAARQPERRPRDATVLLDDVRQAGRALSRGVANDPALATKILGGISPAEALTETLPSPVSTTAVLPEVPLPPRAIAPTRAITPTAPPEQPGGSLRARRVQRRKRGLVALIAVLLISLLAGVGVWYYVVGRWVDVPGFASLTQAQAEELAVEKGLTLKFDSAYSETVAAGTIIDSDPATGAPVLIGGSVTVRVSKGPERYAVPKVVGMSLTDATAALTDAHLAVGTTKKVYHDTAPVDSVISSSMKDGELVPPGTVVDLEVSQGPAPVPIMDFTGKPLAEAKTFYDKAGLQVKVSESVFHDTVAKDSIVSQTPVDGELLRGQTVTVVTSKGPDLVAVPNVRQLSRAAAIKKLEDAGLKYTTKQLWGSGLALGTNPGEGKMVPRGSTVELMLG